MIMDRLDLACSRLATALGERAAKGCIVEGHGDLRPEHVCLGPPIRIIDRLEFNRELRLVDPFDELAFLGMECARAGVEWAAPLLIAGLRTRFRIRLRTISFDSMPRCALPCGRVSPWRTCWTKHRANRAKWAPRAECYLDQAAAALNLLPQAIP